MSEESLVQSQGVDAGTENIESTDLDGTAVPGAKRRNGVDSGPSDDVRSGGNPQDADRTTSPHDLDATAREDDSEMVGTPGGTSIDDSDGDPGAAQDAGSIE